MKCHYEVLEVSREAEDSEIKSAYRKLALKWHPDKNLDNPDFAKEQFQVVQQAYEVLSDRQERAWYDAHREQILRGANSEFQDKSLDVFQYFSTTCFKGYTDDDTGFYGVYRKVFEQIAKEDVKFIDEKEEFCEIPCFGGAHSDYEDVKAFYDYWMSYSTKKSYSWLDPYDIREGKGDRRLMKIIEKENKKIRLKAKKERNEEVRNLVAFVRKRDKRVQAFKKEMEAKTLENRKKQEELSKQKRLERKQMHANEKQADWLKFDNVKSELEEIERHLAKEFGEELSQSDDNDDEKEEDMDLNNLYCVACNKIFKNPNAFENHELSKKHKENVERLREVMMEEENMNENSDLSEEQSIENEEEINELLESENDDKEMTKTNKKKKKKKNILKHSDLPDKEEFDSSKSQKNKKLAKNNSQINGSSDIDITQTSDKEDFDTGTSESQMNKNIANDDSQINGSSDNDITQISDTDDFDFGTSKSQKKKARKNKPKQQADENTSPEPTAKKPSRKEKRAGKKGPTEPTDVSEIDLSHCCVTCKSTFPSKNKLFDHLKKTNHGVFLPTKAKQTGKKNSLKGH